MNKRLRNIMIAIGTYICLSIFTVSMAEESASSKKIPIRMAQLLEQKQLDQKDALLEVEIGIINLENALSRLNMKCHLNLRHNEVDSHLGGTTAIVGFQTPLLPTIYEDYFVYLLDMEYEIRKAKIDLYIAISNCESNLRSIEYKYQMLVGKKFSSTPDTPSENVLNRARNILDNIDSTTKEIYKNYLAFFQQPDK